MSIHVVSNPNKPFMVHNSKVDYWLPRLSGDDFKVLIALHRLKKINPDISLSVFGMEWSKVYESILRLKKLGCFEHCYFSFDGEIYDLIFGGENE